MNFREDWEGLAQERKRAWDAEVRTQQLIAHLPRRRARWRRWASAWLIGVGGSLTGWGKAIAVECEGEHQISVVDGSVVG
jgi:hypothetical protein